MTTHRLVASVVVLLIGAAFACGKKSVAPLAQIDAITRAQVQQDSQDATFPIDDSSRLTTVASFLRALPQDWDGPVPPPSGTELTAVLWRADTILGVVWVAPRLVAEQGRGARTVYTKRVSPEVEAQLRALLTP
jgi:hypothetical protein